MWPDNAVVNKILDFNFGNVPAGVTSEFIVDQTFSSEFNVSNRVGASEKATRYDEV